MKNVFYLAFLYINFNVSSFAKSTNIPVKDSTLYQMEKLSQGFALGIFERVIEQAEIQKAHSHNSRNTFTPFTEIHKLYYRFDNFDSIQVSEDRSYYYTVGKVFVSERYRELDYRTEHRNRDAFRSDRDGFYYYCKLYYHERTRDFRLIIYPGFVQNICAPFMHFNRASCPKHALVNYPRDTNEIVKSTPYSLHEVSIRTIIEIPDALSEDFIVDNALTRKEKLAETIKFSEDMKEMHKRKNQQYNLNFKNWGLKESRPYWSGSGFDWVNTSVLNLFILKNNTLDVSLNLSKHMKIFKISHENGLPQNISLISTKNANNEDFSSKSKYELGYRSYESIIPSPSETFIQSDDKGIINLVTSSFPNDKYLTGRNWAYRRFPFIKTGVASIDTCMGKADFDGCITKAQENLRIDTEKNKNVISDVEKRIDDDQRILTTIGKDTIRISETADSLRSAIKTRDSALKALREPFDTAGLKTYLDSIIASADFSGFENLKSLQEQMPQLTQIKLQIDRSETGTPIPDLYKSIRALLETWQTYMNPASKLADSPYAFELSDTFFAKSVNKDILTGETLQIIYAAGDTATFSKVNLLTGLTDIIEKDIEFKAWIKNTVEELYKIKAKILENESDKSKLNSYLVNLSGNRLSARNLNDKIYEQNANLQTLNGGLKQLEKGSRQMDLAQKFRTTFLPGQVPEAKYFIYINTTSFKVLRDTLLKTFDPGSPKDEQFQKEIFGRIKAFYEIFKNPLYVRASLPILTESIFTEADSSRTELSRFIKNQVVEVYEPFDVDRIAIKEKYKGRMSQDELDNSKGWKDAYFKTIFKMLKSQQFEYTKVNFDLNSNRLSNGDSVHKESRNHNTVWTIRFEGKEYQWLQISEELFRELRYINWFFNRYDRLKKDSRRAKYVKAFSKSV